MTDYAPNIDTQSYLFKLPVYYTNPVNRDRNNVIIRMVLDYTNFTFGYTKSDGSDIRISEQQDGTRVLHMWIAHWSTKKNYANIYFKLPTLLANETTTLWLFFGNSSADSISNPDEIGFIFYENFEYCPLSPSKWSGTYTNNYISLLGFYLDRSFTSNNFYETVSNPMQNKTSWIIEFGTYLDGAIADTASTSRAFSLGFTGENPFYIKFIAGGGLVHNAASSDQAATVYIQGTNYGPEPYSYQETFIAYDDSQPILYQRSLDRNTYPNTVNTIYRNIDGDTVLNNIIICGGYRYTGGWGAYPAYMSWLVVREFDVADRVLINCSGVRFQDRLLYPKFDFNDYGEDLTNTECLHETDFGGDPLLLSDNSSDTVWTSNTNATLQPYISITIHFGSEPQRIIDINNHYDSKHVKYFRASKLSDADTDSWGRNFWDCPANSNSWAAIKLNNRYIVNSFFMTPVYESETVKDNYPKDYIFYGSNYSPITHFEEAIELCRGTFKQAFVKQQVFFNSFTAYKYYILYIINNYGGNNIRIQELELYNIPKLIRARKIQQLRLLPDFGGSLYNFPNEISVQASTDLLVWNTVLPWTFTYSPFMEYYSQNLNERSYWQPYQFMDDTEYNYWAYRLLCRGNWGEADGKISIKEWELREFARESNTYRILEGASNNIRQIWTSEQCGINDDNNTIFATNDKLNYIIGNYAYAFSDILPYNYYDINVINGV